MADIISFDVVVKSWNGKSTQAGKVRVESWSKPQRTKRALKIWGAGWGLAVLSIFLPAAHFVLVPGFFLGSPLLAIYFLRQRSAVIGGEGTCPDCGKPLTIVRGPDHWPLEDVCSQCQAHVIIERTSR